MRFIVGKTLPYRKKKYLYIKGTGCRRVHIPPVVLPGKKSGE